MGCRIWGLGCRGRKPSPEARSHKRMMMKVATPTKKKRERLIEGAWGLEFKDPKP